MSDKYARVPVQGALFVHCAVGVCRLSNNKHPLSFASQTIFHRPALYKSFVGFVCITNASFIASTSLFLKMLWFRGRHRNLDSYRNGVAARVSLEITRIGERVSVH